MRSDPLAGFHPVVADWFRSSFPEPTLAQEKGWPAILSGRSTLLLAPTGSGKTLAAFLAAIDRLMFSPEPAKPDRCRVVYISPLKALAVDVERNLRAPVAGISDAAARAGVAHRVPAIAIRTGDTPSAERARLLRAPPDILITTPESLYLMLTARARAVLAPVETVIVDEIHAVAASKRGTHLFLSLERLEEIRGGRRPLQRIGLSATQRPLEEIARLLGGGTVKSVRGAWTPRPVEVVDTHARKNLELRVEVPVEDMARLGADKAAADDGGVSPRSESIWPSIYPRLVELVRAHRSTMIFANSRRLAERLAAAINETAGEEIALAHHGSVAREKRREIEERLKSGSLPAIVATSSLELGIDMGAVDLVIQIEAPPSIASGLQRIGRAGHSVGETSRGVVFPKYRGDLLAAAAATARMQEGLVEETAYPRNPLDVLAQQIVAMAAEADRDVDDLFRLVRRAAPFADLPRSSFDGVLDMLSGRYPSDEFAELRPRITWDRRAGRIRAREGAGRVAIVNGGTIPDRGLYGVFLAGGDARGSRRVGELDEEMVFESTPGDVFVLGASSWRIEEITHDRVLVSPAPGLPGKMPFWHGDQPGRPTEFGRAIGELARTLAGEPAAAAAQRLRDAHGLDPRAAENLVAYLADQRRATGEVPTDRTIVVERIVDEIGDWRVCVLSPYGARVHAPWATAVLARLREETATDVEALWSDDGMVFRLPESAEPPETPRFLPPPEDVEDLVVRRLGDSSLFAARFRENAARALLLPRRHPGRRSPLWAQRKRAADLLAVAARYGSFPILLETYRECLRDVFDLPGTVDVLRRVANRRIRVLTVDTATPSPFAASLLFSYVANFIYDGDAPLAERRAQALSVDQAQLRELLGEEELRELLDPEAITALGRSLQRLEGRRVRHADGLHDLLLSLGDLTETEIRARAEDPGAVAAWLGRLRGERRVVELAIGGEPRVAAAEDAGRLRDALGVVPPPDLPESFLEPVADPLGDVLARYARTRGPFRAEEAAARFGLPLAEVRRGLERLSTAGRVVEGDFLPGGRFHEWCDAGVLRAIKRRSLAKLRREVEPVDGAVFGRFLLEWQGVAEPASGAAGLLAAVERLDGAPLVASTLETEILPARVAGYRAGDLDALCAAGEVTWRGAEPLGSGDGRIVLSLAGRPAPPHAPAAHARGPLAESIRELLARRGALFFADLKLETGGFPGDLLEALWELVWRGEVTNDTLAPLRSRLRPAAPRREGAMSRFAFSRRAGGPPGSEGRWTLVRHELAPTRPSETRRRTELADVLLSRYGVVTREAVNAEGIAGGFGSLYPVLKAMEEAGKIRRGYFVAGLGAAQFALPAAADRVRAMRAEPETAQTLFLAATDPANPYGAALPWPAGPTRPQRAAGAHVILRNGALLGWLGRGDTNLAALLPEGEPDRQNAARDLARALAALVDSGKRRAVLVARVDGADPASSALAPHLLEAGFQRGSRGYVRRRAPGIADRLAPVGL
ncbi:MAG TPA: DEAD/DEAH box helicase [Thermoanaerobaculia bacterium]|nr:DEAD/DEAH box helicase [Thermoanaerobaculia bacterium]